ncbi:hypothetical protein CH63R_02346 [Colletotrichum higginsianum IMI 349063]|uniref:Uncharacterized protein n=1 Tax=Colletotrichum higginsianum (strain IMI 349063) TaxID=759273 RepID=A0A1B7YNK2_COLHI|nr:hypothetical protein CH63R_02346 [Colletotrichum higginsianum IMI 349063]OBR13620.1 hypothetical protein CH63R_02346 [Colletotrichum higginsianum IMI 349063]
MLTMSEPRFDLCCLPDFRHTQDHHQADYIREEFRRVFPGRQLCAAALKPRIASHRRVPDLQTAALPCFTPFACCISSRFWPSSLWPNDGTKLAGSTDGLSWQPSGPSSRAPFTAFTTYIWVTASTFVSQSGFNASTFYVVIDVSIHAANEVFRDMIPA